ncbi:uncharacterized protein LOC131148249 [Malania oleifera]|uniref:uncharacterized protein LOC131148249 n=1 Tax=Malania oleifera TaxID=397392 RepID=UPI0025AEA063|nr:uncharacterized protein LOC131148249 [Malania oleifera]
MGCCLSSRKSSRKTTQFSLNGQDLPQATAGKPRVKESGTDTAHPPSIKGEEAHAVEDSTRERSTPSPTPPPHEEETVKEVLSSETPISKPLTPPVVVEGHKPDVVYVPHQQEEEEEEEEKSVEAEIVLSRAEGVSQVSEIYSASESLESTSQREDNEASSKDKGYDGDGEIHRRVVARAQQPNVATKRTFSGELAAEKDRSVRSSPAGRGPVSSPENRNRNASQQAAKHRSGGPAGVRRGAGDGSARRSRSPSTRAEGGASRADRNRSAAVKTEGRASSRSSDGAEERNRKLEKSEESDFPAANETLENPHVSLECFIFL